MEAVEGARIATDGGKRRSEHRLAATSLRLLSDEHLARLAADGNRAAFAAIYERHHQALYRYCRTITRNDEDARDALQATMLKAMRAIGTKPTKVRAWLYRISHNESISILRSGSRNATDQLDAAEPSAEAPIEARRELRELLDDIGHLSDRQRQALVMRELGGLSYDEVGEALGCSPAAAKQAAFDARTALHELAEARDTDCESIRKRISDGDRRFLRARGVRAHLRSCDPCRRFDATLRTRQAKLAGLVPALSPAASAAILQSVVGGAGASGTVAGAATLGGGAAAIGGGAAATGGGALGGGLAMKGVIAGVAALVATGGAIAIEKERAADRGDGGSAAGVREATDAPPTARAAETATRAPAGGSAAGTGAAGEESSSGAANGPGRLERQRRWQLGRRGRPGHRATPEPPAPQPQGPQPGGENLGTRPPHTHSPPPGGAHPPRPGGAPTGGDAPPTSGTGTRPPGGGPLPSPVVPTRPPPNAPRSETRQLRRSGPRGRRGNRAATASPRPLASYTSSRLRTLPVAFRGSSSRNSISRGTL